MKPAYSSVLVALGLGAVAFAVWQFTKQTQQAAKDTAIAAHETLKNAYDATDILGLHSGGDSNTGLAGYVAEKIGYGLAVLDNPEPFIERGKHAFSDLFK